MTAAPKPWHDTPLHDCGEGAKGPVTPAMDHPTHTGDVQLMRCCACGKSWYEDDPVRVVHAWWSAGAYEGKEEGRR
jgi:hypothetical protein